MLSYVENDDDVRVCRTATFFGHVPWFGILLGRIPWVFLGNKAFLATCRNNAARRLARGTQTPDLFHYLVSALFSHSPPSSPAITDVYAHAHRATRTSRARGRTSRARQWTRSSTTGS